MNNTNRISGSKKCFSTVCTEVGSQEFIASGANAENKSTVTVMLTTENSIHTRKPFDLLNTEMDTAAVTIVPIMMILRAALECRVMTMDPP